MTTTTRLILSILLLSSSCFAQKPPASIPQGPFPEVGCTPTYLSSWLFCDIPDSTMIVPSMSSSNSSDPCRRNDDGSAGPIPLGFNFEFYGNTYTQLWINNNGNLTFEAPYSAFTATGFPAVGVKMIAPFWGDVDTRNVLGGIVRYKSVAGRFTVTWDHVGYYSLQVDKLNSFQVILSDGNDPLVGIGSNICFCYTDMAWTTGAASGGVNGFAGTPATVGINVGDGVNYEQLGRFDQPGAAYDGPGGANDGIDWLDGKRFCFNTAGCGQAGVPGAYDLTINGSYSGAQSGLDVIVPLGSPIQIDFSTLPGARVTLLCSSGCICPGLHFPIDIGVLHLDPSSLQAIFDGCGLLGSADAWAAADTSGDFSISFPTPVGLPPFCKCLQGVVCHPIFPNGFHFTQAYRVCFE